MATYPSLSQPQRVEDLVRGRRTVEYDASGRLQRVCLADGTELRIEGRGIRATDGAFIDLAHPYVNRGDGHHAEQWSLPLPGCPRPLRYSRRSDGTLRIGWEGEVPFLRIARDGSVEWSNGRWDRTQDRLRSRWRIADIELISECDLLARPIRRRWSDGTEELFRRDGEGRLQQWRRIGRAPQSMAFEYNGVGCTGCWTDAGFQEWELDEAGRVLRVGESVYAYDANGRRVRGPGFVYRYDAFGHLRSANGTTYEYDARGRRIAVHRRNGSLYEHRDLQGRLWCIADASGRARHVFVWHEHRPLARLDDGELAEVYLCDEQSTLLAWCDVRTGAVTPVDAPPFGAVQHRARPTLHGHFGDPETDLIHFGAREYDPATAAFLTPDPFHGDADDPRRWSGVDGRLAPADTHPYALARFDPVGRSDRDGHASVGRAIGWGLLNIPFSLTWGWPLTAISAFFFAPIDIYFELAGRIIQIFRLIGDSGSARRAPGFSTFPWPNHSIFSSRFFAGSSRQGQIAFSFNGFLPRVVSGGGIDADRAVTIGQVIWIRQYELDILARPLIVRAYDVEGGGGLTAFNQDSTKISALAVTCTNKKGKNYVHVSFWTRGSGNTIATRPPGAGGGVETFGDLADASGHKPCYMHLARPIPVDVSAPKEKDDEEKLAIAEYLFPSTGNITDVVIDDSVAFALRMKTGSNIKAGDRLKLSFPESAHTDPVCVLVATVDTDSESMSNRSTVLLYQGFTPRVLAPGGPPLEDLTAVRMLPSDGRPALAGWDLDGANNKLKHEAAGAAAAQWPPDVHKGDFVLVKASTAGTAFVALTSTPPPANDTVVVKLTKLLVTVKVTAALPAAPVFGATTDIRFLRIAPGRTVGAIEDAAHPELIKFAGREPSLEKDQFVVVSMGANRGFGRVTTYKDRLLTLEFLGHPLTVVAGTTAATVQLVNPAEEEDDKGTAASPTGDTFAIEAPRAKAFTNGTILLLRDGANQQIRVVDTVTRVQIETSDDVAGTGTFSVQSARIDEKFASVSGISRASLKRFLKRTGGPQPSTYKPYPQAVISIVLQRFGLLHAVLHEFYIQSSAPDLSDYRLRWRPFTFGGNEYFLLDRDLPIYTDGTTTNWFWDRDEPRKTVVTPPFDLQVREFVASGAKRDDTTGPRIVAVEPETLVPEEPDFHFTHHDALVEHETHHTVQNARYGAFMGALPLQGMLNDAVDITQALRGKPEPDWLRAAVPDVGDANQGFTWAELISIGGIMTLAMKYVLLWPLLLGKESRKDVLKLDYNEMMKVMSPIWSAIIRHWPRPHPDDKSPVDPNDQFTDDVGQVIAEFFLRAMDLRSWTPFIGMIPTWLGDGPRNFVEQQASRASGDLYSTILSANDKFNRDTRAFLGLFGRGGLDANLKRPLGDVVRMMIFAGGRSDRLFGMQNADETGWAFRYQEVFDKHSAVTIRTISGGLVHPALYKPTGATLPPVPVLGPDGTTVLDFDNYAANAEFEPRLRALVPIPPQVNRSSGFYFAAVTPGTYHLESFDSDAGNPDKDAKTYAVDLTIENGKVTLDKDEVTWSAPVAHPGPPPLTVKRFFTENAELKIDGQQRAMFKITNDAAPASPVKVTNSKDGAKIEIGGPAGAAPPAVRIRIYRVITKNDPAFTLYYGNDVPELKNIRSYLTSDLWFPVRDFLLQVEALPPLADINIKSNEKHTVSLPLAVERKEKFTVRLDMPAGAPRPLPGAAAVPSVAVNRIGPSTTVSPRGEDWEIGPLSGPIEETATYKLEVEFGTPPRVAPLSCKITVDPAIRLTGAGGLLAKPGAALDLTIAGGTPGYSASLSPEPAGVTRAVAGNTVTITVADAGPNIAAQDVVVTVKDNGGLTGRRTIKVSRP